MPELRVKATELVDTSVDFVSLVKRGANRIPFRIVKQEDETMLDLNKIGRKLFQKNETTGPEVVAAVVPAGADMDKMAEVFQGAGLDPKVFLKTEVDGVVTLAKADADKAEDTVIIKTGDKVGLVISGLKKAFDSYNASGSDFSEAVKAQGFYPSFCTAQDVLGSCVSVALHKSNSPTEAAERVAKTVDDFKSYVSGLAASLPASAFYVDRYYSDIAKAGEETPAEAKKEEPSEADKAKEEADKAKTEEAKKEDGPDDEPKKPESAEKADEPKADAPNAEIAALKKSQDDLMGVLKELQKSVTSAVSGLKDEVKKDMADINSRVEKVAQQAKKTDAALNGTVFAEPDGEKPNQLEKQEGSRGAPPLLDTAYDRREVA